jgi:hypothetical protein
MDISSDEENEYEFNVNNENIPEINEEFRNKVLNIKHSLYKATVLSGKLGSNNAQDISVLNKYLDHINNIYIILLQCQDRNSNVMINTGQFPLDVQDDLNELFKWVRTYFMNNSIPDTIPYSNYITNTFHTYPYVQTDVFEEDIDN